MESGVLNAIPFQIDLEQLAKQLRIKEGSGHLEKLQKLAEQAQAAGKPKAAYRMAYIEERTDDRVKVNGVVLTSRVLRVNLDKAHRVFPFVATCGRELEDWSQGVTDILEKFWADAIKEMARAAGREMLEPILRGAFSTRQPLADESGIPSGLAPLGTKAPIFDPGGRGSRHRGSPDRPLFDAADQIGFRDLVSHRREL